MQCSGAQGLDERSPFIFARGDGVPPGENYRRINTPPVGAFEVLEPAAGSLPRVSVEDHNPYRTGEKVNKILPFLAVRECAVHVLVHAGRCAGALGCNPYCSTIL